MRDFFRLLTAELEFPLIQPKLLYQSRVRMQVICTLLSIFNVEPLVSEANRKKK
jgi:hypothetical protein